MGMEMDNLIVAAQAGSEEALLQLLELCPPQLRRYANRQCASDDIEEAVQDALGLLCVRYCRVPDPGSKTDARKKKKEGHLVLR